MEMNNLLDNMTNPNYINVLRPMQQPMQQMQPQQMQPQQMQQPMQQPMQMQAQFAQGQNPMMNMMGQRLLGQVN